jgi:hypothetical protein
VTRLLRLTRRVSTGDPVIESLLLTSATGDGASTWPHRDHLSSLPAVESRRDLARDARRSGLARVVGEVCVPGGRRMAPVTEDRPQDRQAESCRRTVAREGMAQIVKPQIREPRSCPDAHPGFLQADQPAARPVPWDHVRVPLQARCVGQQRECRRSQRNQLRSRLRVGQGQAGKALPCLASTPRMGRFLPTPYYTGPYGLFQRPVSR